MKLSFFSLIFFMLFSCSTKTDRLSEKTSYWKTRMDSFATKDLKSFVIDSQLESTYKNFRPVKNRTIDSVIGYGTPYLYSWQNAGSEFSAFTTVVDDGEHGRRIVYFIFDDNDSLCSATQVANKGGEGGIIYETRSRFISKDTLYKTSAATTQWDLSKPNPWEHRLTKTKGDSTFFYLTISKSGQIVEKQYAERKELNLE